MSIPLPTVNLANVNVGQSGTISLTNVGVSAGGVSANPAGTQGAGNLHIFNESGSGLLISFLTDGSAFYLPAGGWVDKVLRAGEQGIRWTVLYNLPNPPVTLLLVTYYYPGEPLPRVPMLGNSPIGIGGTVSTSSVNTLTNEGNASQTLVIDIGQTGNTLLITINSDGSFVWSVLQAGVAHQVLKAQTSGNPLQIGKSGDVSEVLGQLSVDGVLFCSANEVIANGIWLQWKDSGGTARNIMQVDATNNTNIDGIAGTGVVVLSSSPGSAIFKVQSTGVSILAGAYGMLTGDNLARLGDAAGTGTSTINHNLGAVPDFASVTTHVAGSQTVGYDSETSTQLHVTCGSGLAFFVFLSKRS
jgi:hypothetical protein